VIFFALFGSLFVLTQYLQLVHGYSPFGAGVRALPFALAMGAVAPLSTTIAKKLGTRLVVPAGLALMGLGLADLSTAGVHTPYPPLAVAVAIMGAGMGLVMAPASDTIMASVPADQAGAGSAVNDTVREVGGALGVAVVGSVAAAAYGHSLGRILTSHHAPPVVVHAATGSVAAADAVGAKVGGPVGAELVAAAHSSFVSAMSTGLKMSAAVAVLGAVVTFVTLPRRSAPVAVAAEATTPAPAGDPALLGAAA